MEGRIYVQEDLQDFCVVVHYVIDMPNGTRHFHHMKDGQFVQQTKPSISDCAFDPNERPVPLLKLAPDMFRDFLQQVVDYASTKGINPTAEFQKGKIEAMEANLEDLRNMLKIGEMQKQPKPTTGAN